MAQPGNIEGQRIESGSADVEEGKKGSARITKQRALHVNIRDNEGVDVSGAGTNYAGTPADSQVAVGNGVAAQIPASPPSVPYRIHFSVDSGSSGAWQYRGVTGTTLGHPFFPGQVVHAEMAASASLFVYHDQGTSQDVNVTVEPLS